MYALRVLNLQPTARCNLQRLPELATRMNFASAHVGGCSMLLAVKTRVRTRRNAATVYLEATVNTDRGGDGVAACPLAHKDGTYGILCR